MTLSEKLFLLLLVFLSPLVLKGQSGKRVPDSIRALLHANASVEARVQQLESMLWYIFLDSDLSLDDYPEQLDSLYHCCIEGKVKDKEYSKKILGEVLLFKAAAIYYEEPNNAKELLDRALPLFTDIQDSSSLAATQMYLCQVAEFNGDSIAFTRAYDECRRVLPARQTPEFLSMIYNNLGISCWAFGRYAEAADFYFKILDLTDRFPSQIMKDGIASTYHNIAGIYLRLGDYSNALFYTDKALLAAEEAHQDVSYILSMKGTILLQQQNYSTALNLFKNMLTYSKMDTSLNFLAGTTFRLATCYRKLGDLEQAFLYAKRGTDVFPISRYATYGAMALLELANCQFSSEEILPALNNANIAFQTLSQAKSHLAAAEAADLLATIYKSIRKFDKALEFRELSFQYQQFIERQQSNRQLAFGEFSRENAARQARREAEIKAELDLQRSIRYALMAGLGVLAFIAFLLFNRYRFKQRTAAQLQAKNAEVEAARLRAEKSEAFKSRFLANMSHEIRTPLHGITGFADLLQDTSLTEKQRRWLSAIHQSSLRLKDVVNDILDISKLEAGEVTLRSIAFSPEQVVQDVAETLQPKVVEKGIKLILESDPDVPKAVRGDPARLYQVLTNLAGNAVKFTERGGVTISMSSQLNTATDEATILFSVKDTGIGIPPERLHVIFESFQQADESTTAQFGGTGLGLTIARDLVRLHGSDIEVLSEVGIGSEFSFLLTCPMADTTMLSSKSTNLEDVYEHPINVLVVDDNAFNREISMEALHKHFEHVTVDMAVNGLEAVEKVAKQSFDIVLMDMQMPEMNGLEATKRIRQMTKEQHHMPIVALTASATPDEIQDALDAGMDRHLGKPFQPAELAKVIADVLHLESKQTAPLPQVQDRQSAMDVDINGYDLRFLRDFCSEDEEQVQYFINKFQTQLPLELDRMEAALASRDYEQVYLVAHSFRPQLEFVGLKSAAIAMLQIEKGAKANQDMNELMDLFIPLKSQGLC